MLLKTSLPLIVDGAQPFLLGNGPIGCLLLHGFTSSPEEMRYLGSFLADAGHTVLGVRLAGHGTSPEALQRTRWFDWLLSVEEALALLQAKTGRCLVIGQSMGGMLALVSAAFYPLAGVVAISTPFLRFGFRDRARWFGQRLVSPMVRKDAREHPQWGPRREADYPAYTRFPIGIFGQLARLQEAVEQALPAISAPALLLQSRDDHGIPEDSLDQLARRLGSHDKASVWLEGLGHSMVRDDRRDELFGRIERFIDRVSQLPPSE
jgi:carboxylesterase